MTTLSALRAIFRHHRRAWTKAELVAETGKRLSSISPALIALLEEGTVLLTGDKYRQVIARNAVIGQGRQRITDHDAEQARFASLLPATVKDLHAKTGRSPTYIVRALKKMGCTPGLNWVWGTEPSAPPRREANRVLRTPGDEYACVESSSTSWLEVAPTTEGFACERRRMFVTFATCYDDHTTAASGRRGLIETCRKCPRGEQLRADYAQGA